MFVLWPSPVSLLDTAAIDSLLQSSGHTSSISITGQF